jgi:hypothetical protein
MALYAQSAGSALVLVSFVGTQVGRMMATCRPYLLPMLPARWALPVERCAGCAVGFVALESAWMVVSASGLYRSLRPRAVKTNWAANG